MSRGVILSNFRIHVLASGSKGNATLVQAENQYFLIDLGLSCKELTRRLKLCGVEPSQLEAVFITHEHSDHIKGMATFLKKHTVPIYTSFITWKAIKLKLGAVITNSCRVIDEEMRTGKIKVSSFPIPHDARDPHGYSFTHLQTGEKFTYITDTGFVTDPVLQAAEGAQVLMLEANHDVEMLKRGPYPFHLKQRILSTLGHLSNETSGQLLSQLKQPPREVILAHLSEENNRPQLALQTICQQLEAVGRLETTRVLVASQSDIVSTQDMPVEAALF